MAPSTGPTGWRRPGASGSQIDLEKGFSGAEMEFGRSQRHHQSAERERGRSRSRSRSRSASMAMRSLPKSTHNRRNSITIEEFNREMKAEDDEIDRLVPVDEEFGKQPVGRSSLSD
ncbi:hypothetical protein T439DRAFT_328377 [Meredithblackwellia eburnea MCA 4105]